MHEKKSTIESMEIIDRKIQSLMYYAAMQNQLWIKISSL